MCANRNTRQKWTSIDIYGHWKAGGQRTIMNIQFTKTKMQKFNQDSGDLEVGLELGTVGNAYIA